LSNTIHNNYYFLIYHVWYGRSMRKNQQFFKFQLKKIWGKSKCQNAGLWVYKKIVKIFFLELLTYYLGSVGWICKKNGNQDNHNNKASFIRFKISKIRGMPIMEREAKISKKKIFFSESGKSEVSHKKYFLQISHLYPIFKCDQIVLLAPKVVFSQ
jgi:hypothetical protein